MFRRGVRYSTSLMSPASIYSPEIYILSTKYVRLRLLDTDRRILRRDATNLMTVGVWSGSTNSELPSSIFHIVDRPRSYCTWKRSGIFKFFPLRYLLASHIYFGLNVSTETWLGLLFIFTVPSSDVWIRLRILIWLVIGRYEISGRLDHCINLCGYNFAINHHRP